ncbi:MAG: cation:proton antiporter domain-containing protein [Candidatus Heimdallarchaeota archaeon]
MFEDLVERIKELFIPTSIHYLLIIGLIILLVVFAAYVFKRINVPEALGFIIMGIIIGPSLIGIITPEMITCESKIIFKILTGVALGFIGFHIGNEIKFSAIKKNFKQYSAILIGQAVIALFLIVLGVIGWIYGFHANKSFFFVFLLAAVALPTAPAITASVIKEAECSGPTTSTMMFVIGLDDVIGIIAFEFALGMAVLYYLPGGGSGAIAGAILGPLINIAGSILIGLLLGLLFAFVLNRVKRTTLTIEFFLGTLLAIVGITEVLGWSELLACMTFGVIIGNMQTERNERAVRYGEQIFSPFIMLFFVFAGASLDIQAMFTNWLVIVVAITMVIVRLAGKWLGAFIGAAITKSPRNIRRYVGPGLFAQGEMTIGLSMVIFNLFVDISDGAESGTTAALAAADGAFLLNVLGLSILIFQIISPFTTKWALAKAGELPAALEPKPPLKVRMQTGMQSFFARVRNFFVILTTRPAGRKAREKYVNISPADIGTAAGVAAAESIVEIATSAAIEAAVPAAAEAAADAAVETIISAVSEKSIESPLEAPLEEISQAVKDLVSQEVEEKVRTAVTSAVSSPLVVEEIGEVVENIVDDSIEEAQDIEELDVAELLNGNGLHDKEDCEIPPENDDSNDENEKEDLQENPKENDDKTDG